MSPDHQRLLESMPLATHLGVRLMQADPQQVRASLGWAPQLCTAGGALHGGALMALADSAGAVCAYLNLPAGARTATVESKTNFFRAVREGVVHAVSAPLHVGGSQIVVRTELGDEQGRAVGHTVQTQAVLGT